MADEEQDGGSTAVVPAGREFSADDLDLLADLDALAPERSAISVDRELAEIAKLRREDPRAYWRADVQARQRELLATKAVDYPIARQAVQQVFDGIPADERADFEASFDALPRGAIDVIREFLDVAPGGSVRPASDADLKRFTSTPEGEELVKAWRGRAAQKLGILRQRIELMRMSMSPEDADAAMRWLDDLPGPHAKAVLLVLAG
jgi:hypothetical protein